MISQGIGRSVAGRERVSNENAFSADDALGLYVISDGIGGLPSGEIASAVTIQAVCEFVKGHQDVLEEIRAGNAPEENAIRLAEDAMRHASSEVYLATFGHSKRSGMGSTATLVIMLGGKAVMAHVGNTRLFLYRKSQVFKLSNDHTMAAEYVRRGLISEAQSQDNVFSSVLTRSVGTFQSTLVDTLLFDLLPGDRMLLASNGLAPVLTDKTTFTEALEGDFKSVVDTLIDTALEKGTKDDVTAIAIQPDRELFGKRESRPSYMPLERYFTVLSSVHIFNELSMRQLQRVLNLGRVECFKTGDTLAKENHYCPGMLIVLEGLVEVIKGREKGGVLATGDAVEEAAIVSDRPCHATYVVLAPSRVLTIERDAFNHFASRYPRIGISLLKQLSQRLSKELEIIGDKPMVITKAGEGMLNL